jgi:Ca2+-binding EF-hand superfamily protein
MQKFDEQPAEFVKIRLRKLDSYIRSKVSEKWVSVRQAFLDLDLDHDGFIVAKDILTVLGESKIEYQMLKKLFKDLT